MYGYQNTCTADATARTRPSTVETVETSPTTASRAVCPPTVVEHRQLSQKNFGEAHLVWRCDDCGELGPLTAFPTACPGCGAGREALFYCTED